MCSYCHSAEDEGSLYCRWPSSFAACVLDFLSCVITSWLLAWLGLLAADVCNVSAPSLWLTASCFAQTAPGFSRPQGANRQGEQLVEVAYMAVNVLTCMVIVLSLAYLHVDKSSWITPLLMQSIFASSAPPRPLDSASFALQAQPEVLFEGTVAEGAPFKVKAAIVDWSGFPDSDDEHFELDFRYVATLVRFHH